MNRLVAALAALSLVLIVILLKPSPPDFDPRNPHKTLDWLASGGDQTKCLWRHVQWPVAVETASDGKFIPSDYQATDGSRLILMHGNSAVFPLREDESQWISGWIVSVSVDRHPAGGWRRFTVVIR